MIRKTLAALPLAVAAVVTLPAPAAHATPGWLPDYAQVVAEHDGLTVGDVVPVGWVTGPAEGCPIFDRMCAFVEIDGTPTLVEDDLEDALVPAGPDLDGAEYPAFVAEARLKVPGVENPLDQDPRNASARPIYTPDRVWVSEQTVDVGQSPIAMSGTWVRVGFGLEDGWVHTDWLKPLAAPEPKVTETPEPTPEPESSPPPQPSTAPEPDRDSEPAARSAPAQGGDGGVPWLPLLGIAGVAVGGSAVLTRRGKHNNESEES